MSIAGRIGGGARRILLPASIMLGSGCASTHTPRPAVPGPMTSHIAQCSSTAPAGNREGLSIALTCTIKFENETPAMIFYFFRNLNRYYLDISEGHIKYEPLNAATLEKGIIIDVEETAGGQYVIHRYRVEELIEGRYIKLVSDPSHVRIWGGLFTVTVRTTVEFEIHPDHTLSSKLTLEFMSGFSHSLAGFVGTREIWQDHIKEEMENAARIIRSASFIRDYESMN